MGLPNGLWFLLSSAAEELDHGDIDPVPVG
jgi:hypothetical protein